MKAVPVWLDQACDPHCCLRLVRTLKETRYVASQMVLKVAGRNEYIDEGEVMDYVYIRTCLKKGKEILLALVPHPNLHLPELPPPPPPPEPTTPPNPSPETIIVWNLPPRACLRVRIMSVCNALAILCGIPGG